MERFTNLSLTVFGFLALCFMWLFLLGAVCVASGVLLHACGVFTCDTIYCS